MRPRHLACALLLSTTLLPRTAASQAWTVNADIEAVPHIATFRGGVWNTPGIQDGGHLGRSVAGLGDINGDGLDDLVIGAPRSFEYFDNTYQWHQWGAAHIYFGTPTWTTNADVYDVGAGAYQADVVFEGEEHGSYVGLTFAGIGDLDADGFDDFLIGAPQYQNDDDGEVYLILGQQTWPANTAPIDLSTAAYSLVGDPNHPTYPLYGLGGRVATAGFVDGDAVPELLFTSSDCGNAHGGGVVVLVSGALFDAGTWIHGMSVHTLALNNTDDVVFFLPEYDGVGTGGCSNQGFGEDDTTESVVGGGDIDADGFDDVVVGAFRWEPNGGTNHGKVYLLFGDTSFPAFWKESWSTGLTIDDVAGASLVGYTDNMHLGRAVAMLGDVNGDTLDDLAIGAPGHGAGIGYRAGEVYVVFGDPGLSVGTLLGVNLEAEIGGSIAGASIVAEAVQSYLGSSLAGPGDVDWDGVDDLLIGAGDYQGIAEQGKTYLVFGDSPWGVDMTLYTTPSWEGELNIDHAGYSVAGPGDVNGDLVPDLLIGAPNRDEGGQIWGLYNAGKAYLIAGVPDCYDFDLDGYGDPPGPECDDPALADCDDDDPLTYPGAPELCDAVDNDCDGAVDEGMLDDGDGDGYTPCDGDCDDADPALHPGAHEACDGIDNDCDGVVDDGVYDDADGDGYDICDGDCDDDDPDLNLLDADGDGWHTCEGDCDDGEPTIYPGAAELCDGVDNDCDGVIPADEADGDGDGYAPCDGDCDDTAPDLNLDDADNDGATTCDGDCDDGDPSINLDDADGDGFSTCDDDCDDDDPDSYPGAPELCDGADNDCDGATDEGVDDDADGDGYSTCDGDCDDSDADLNLDDADGDGVDTCSGDCDDDNPGVHPGALEDCNGLDDDCDGTVPGDERDEDGDGFMACEGDCDDTDPDVHPGADEVPGNDIDEDCDGNVDVVAGCQSSGCLSVRIGPNGSAEARTVPAGGALFALIGVTSLAWSRRRPR